MKSEIRLLPFSPANGVVHYKLVEAHIDDGDVIGWAEVSVANSKDRLKETLEDCLKAFDRPLYLDKK